MPTNLLSITKAVAYINQAGLKISESKLRSDSDLGLISFELTEGNHRRYTIDDLITYIERHFYKKAAIVEATKAPSLAVNGDIKRGFTDGTVLLTINSHEADKIFLEIMGGVEKHNVGHLMIGPGIYSEQYKNLLLFLLESFYNKKVSITICNSPVYI